MDEDAPLTFLAALAPSPMRVMSDGGYRVYLDVPEDELGAVMQLILLRKEYLRFTVAVEEVQQVASEQPKVISWKTRRKVKN